MTQWPFYQLDELGQLGRGKSRHRPRNDVRLYDGNYPFIQTAEVTASELYITHYNKTYSDFGLAQSKIWSKGTLCFVIAGENTGETAILEFDSCFPDSIIGFIANTTKANAKFIKYYFDTIRPQVRQLTKGATQDNLSIDKLLSFKIPTPTIEIQNKIASILSVYDDLIENNTRRIKILEEMVRMLYREWFVNFRFPGHEQVRMVDSSLGLIPEGWEVKTVGEVCSLVKRGISPKYDESSNSIVINQKCIRDFRLSLKESRAHNSKVPAEKYVALGDVLVNSTGVGTLGRVAQVLYKIKDCTVDSHVTIVRPKEFVDADFMGIQMFECQGHFESLGQGATGQTELGREAIASTDFLWAPSEIQKKFSAVVKPMRNQVVTLLKKNQNLRQTRDLLLPKLISGEIEV